MKTPAPAVFAFAAALAVSATAQPNPGPNVSPPAHAPRACFWTRMVSNFAAVNESTVYVRVGVSQVFELKLFSDCLDLDWVHRIALRSVDGGESDICEGPNPGVDVVVREIAIGRQRCPVTGVRKLTPAEVAALPKGARP
jgi:hypothetical protein